MPIDVERARVSDVLARLTAALSDRYTVVRELGAGGMATVYLAHDLRHERDVAIKVLHPDLGAALGAERFLSEIKTTAKLQHPHILPLLDSGAADGLLYYVMPYVRGETLRARLERERQLPVPDALRIAREVAGALDHAHKQGIIHRDIKPENILLQDGAAVVADFGIALAVQSAGTQRLTQTGLSLGTPQYMSPEQAMGERTIDARSDIYALGAVTYEMLAGEPPFSGASTQAIVVKVLSERPVPLVKLRDTVPPAVDAAVSGALAKTPADRPSDANEFARALGEPSAGSAAFQPPRPARRRSMAMLGAACLATAALGAGAMRWLAPAAAAGSTVHRIVLWRHALAPLTSSTSSIVASQAALSPDGALVVFADTVDRRLLLLRKARGELNAAPIVGTDGATAPFFSPDGAWIGFLTVDNKLRKAPTGGGTPVTLLDVGLGNFAYRSGAWTDDDEIVFIQTDFSLARVSANGGTPRPLRLPTGIRWVQVQAVAGTSRVLALGCPGPCSAANSTAFVYDLAADSGWTVKTGVVAAWVTPTGHLLWGGGDGTVFASPVDGDLRPTGVGVPVLDNVEYGTFSVSRTGDLLYVPRTAGVERRELLWVLRDGSRQPVDTGWREHFEYPALSPDGRSLAVSVVGATTDLWVRGADGARRQVTRRRVTQWRPFWEANGSSLLFIGSGQDSTRAPSELLRVDLRVPGAPEVVRRVVPSGVYEGETNPDGEWLAYRSDDPKGGANLWAQRLRGDTTRLPIATSLANEVEVALSPDGRMIAYASNETGQHEIYVAAFPSLQGRTRVSVGGGLEPRWRRDGRELYFVWDATLFAASIAANPLSATQPRALFSVEGLLRARNRAEYDVAPDGRFLMVRETPSPETPPVVLVQNWFAELRRKAGS